MRWLICAMALLLCLPAGAQEREFPTLEALANMTISAFDYVDMVDRMSAMNTDYRPPAEGPQYEVGDREWFILGLGEDYESKRVQMELRAQSDRVLIWAEVNVDYPPWRAQALTRRVENYVLDPVQKLLGYAEPAGVDGDPRFVIALVHDPEGPYGGYFSRGDVRPRSIASDSNQRELVVVNLATDEEYDFFDSIIVDILAHEYFHVLQQHSDFGEESWLDEALATYVGFQASKRFLSRSTGHAVADSFLEAPDTGLTQWQSVEDRLVKYGAGFLFITYLSERFGAEIPARLLAEPSNGWRSVTKVLRDEYGASADEVFADWVLANYFQESRRGYGYRELDKELSAPRPAAALNSFPAVYEGELPQYSTDYIAVDARGAEKLLLRLWQAPEARLIDQAPVEGDFFAYAVPADYGYARLTRAFDLNTYRQARMQFRLWYNLDDEMEYAYVTLSEDGGETWQTLRGEHSEWTRVYDDFYAHGYTGHARFWRFERIDLSDFAPGEVLIRFELMSDYGTTYGGVAIDDIRISAIDFQEGFETPDDAWEYEGWIRTDNRLPNKTWLQVAQDTGGELHVSRELVTGNGELTVELLPGASQALVAVSPITLVTSLRSEYELEVSLLDAAGEVLAVSRECSVTTTDPLNFRATPNGRKIGLLPKGTTVDALDKEGDWFQVEYNGARGWVHGDYVNAAGECP